MHSDRRQSDHRFVWAILALALICRLAVFVSVLRHPEPHFTQPDSGSYLRAAESLRSRGGFVDDSGRPTGRRPPGYPLLLSAMLATGLASTQRVEVIVLVQIVLATLTVALTYVVATRFGDPGTAPLAAALMSVEPSNVALSNLVLSETLYTLILVGLLLTWWAWLARMRIWELAAGALLTGLLPLIRPVGLYLPVVLGPLVWAASPPRRRMRLTVIYLGLALFLPACWKVRNYYLLGSSEFCTTGPLAKAMFARQVADLAGVPHPGSSSVQPWDQYFAEAGGLSVPAAMKIQNQYFRDTVLAYPVSALHRFLTLGFLLVGVPDAQLPSMVLSSAPTVVGGSIYERLVWLVDVGPIGALLLLGVAVSLGGFAAIPLLARRATTWNRSRRRLLAFLVTITLYHLALGSLVAYQAARYRAPVMPVLCILVSAASIMFLRTPRMALNRKRLPPLNASTTPN